MVSKATRVGELLKGVSLEGTWSWAEAEVEDAGPQAAFLVLTLAHSWVSLPWIPRSLLTLTYLVC